MSLWVMSLVHVQLIVIAMLMAQLIMIESWLLTSFSTA